MLISPLYKYSLDFNNAYFCCWNKNIWGGLANIWGACAPPRPQRRTAPGGADTNYRRRCLSDHLCVTDRGNSAVHHRAPCRQCSFETNYLILVRSQASDETGGKKAKICGLEISTSQYRLSHKQCKIRLRQLFNTGCPLVPIAITLNDLEQL